MAAVEANEAGIERVHVRAKWKHEAHDFTLWLARHLDLLGEAIGIPLELKRREAPVGPLFLDILARDTDSDVLVAIENQLEPANLQHLGQLVAYATGLDARAAVWVAPEFSYHHGTALHRLNEWTRDGIRFYAVKIEVVRRNSDPNLEARFRRVVWPGGWDEDALVQPEEESPSKRRYSEFFQPLIARLVTDGFTDRTVQHFDHTGRRFPSASTEAASCSYAASLGTERCWVTFHVRANDIERTNRIFDELHASREEIEAEFAARISGRDEAGGDPRVPDWSWGRYDPFYFFSISVARDGSILDSERHDEIRAWMLDQLPHLKAVFDPRIAVILNRITSEEPPT
ncbi:MAG: DUF4268 domain-containing protein [Chloroflexi bacterium]|nr:DUF4268 domain-containing protein [Chloroflexota bacterium]